jgi:hypothetical protein
MENKGDDNDRLAKDSNRLIKKNEDDNSPGNPDKLFINVPSFIFRDRSVAVLESLVEYLRDIKKMNYHEIAIMLNRNDRTIWTVYHRAKKKRKR